MERACHHYENTPMQYQRIFSALKLQISLGNKCDMFNIFAQNIDRRGGSNEYPQSMFWIKNKKNICTPVNPIFTVLGGIDCMDMFA